MSIKKADDLHFILAQIRNGGKMSITGLQEQVFRQGELLQALQGTYGALAEEQETVEKIKGGICYMLSIEWLLKLLGQPNAYPASVYDTQFENSETAMYYKQIANNYYIFSENWSYTFENRAGHPGAEKMPGTRMVEIDRHYVERCSMGKYTVPNTFNQFTAAADITGMYGGNCALLLYLNVIPNTPPARGFGHEMALWRYNGQGYFYDPNEGVFKLPDFSRIVGEIISGYTATVPGGAQAQISITQIEKI